MLITVRCFACHRAVTRKHRPSIRLVSTDSFKPPTKKRRRRHDFGAIPSFQEFQHQHKVKSLYRQYVRLIWRVPDRTDLLSQVRHEFRHAIVGDAWQMQRALSEGGRRLKELSAMLANTVRTSRGAADDGSTPPFSSSTRPQWPWEHSPQHVPPLHVPRKSNNENNTTTKKSK